MITMVKMYFLAVIRKQTPKSVILSNSCDLGDFNFFHKKGAKEFMRFSTLTLVERIDPEEMVSVKERKYICSACMQQDNLAAAAVTDDEYPTKVAHMCLEQLLSDFSAKIHRQVWENSESVEYPYLQELHQRFSDPKDLNRMSVVQGQVDETKIILHQTIENVLKRGENLDDLVNKTDELSLQAKTFYRSARKSAACCTGMTHISGRLEDQFRGHDKAQK